MIYILFCYLIMFIQKIRNIEKYYIEACQYFNGWEYPYDIKKESLIARFFISQNIDKIYWIKKYIPETNCHWAPVFSDDIRWSISHTEDMIFIWVALESIWVDTEIYKKRDICLLNYFSKIEYELLWWKNFKNFYIIWTAKESLIKYHLSWLDDIENISLVAAKVYRIEIDWVSFLWQLILSYRFKYYTIYSGEKAWVVYSFCYDTANSLKKYM